MTRFDHRFQGWLRIDDWGPVCVGCGADEFRIDGYCSPECRDYHTDDDVETLVRALKAIERYGDNAARQMARNVLYREADRIDKE